MAVNNACGDQDPDSHAANLADVGRRYAEVLTTEDVINYFDSFVNRTHTASLAVNAHERQL